MYVSLKEREKRFGERVSPPSFIHDPIPLFEKIGRSRLINILTQPLFVLVPAMGYN